MKFFLRKKYSAERRFFNFCWFVSIIFQVFASRRRRKVYLLGSVEHMNYGDHAINMAEEIFIDEKYDFFINIPEELIQKSIFFIKLFKKKNDIFFFHGGGNMGDVWPYQEKLRQKVYESFPNNKIIIFPQSCNFKTDSLLLKRTKFQLKKCREVILLLRDKKSFAFAKNNFPDNVKLLLVPDIALSLPAVKNYSFRQKGLITFFLRRDVEKLESKLMFDLRSQLMKKYKIIISDTVRDDGEIVCPKNRKEFLTEKLNEFCKSELIVSDRLHAMVLAQITGTPAIIFDNNNHKIKNLYETWLSDRKNIFLVSKTTMLEDILKFVGNVNAVQNLEHDNKEYKKVIIDAIW